MKNVENQNNKSFSTEKKGNKKDFHKSFWPLVSIFILILIFWFMVINNYYKINYRLRDILILITFAIYLLTIILSIILRFTLSNKNFYLAKGFMWGAIVLIAIPFIVTTLLFGACLIAVI